MLLLVPSTYSEKNRSPSARVLRAERAVADEVVRQFPPEVIPSSVSPV